MIHGGIERTKGKKETNLAEVLTKDIKSVRQM